MKIYAKGKLTLDLKRLSLSWLGKHPLGSGFHKVVVLGKKLCEWNYFLINGTQRGWRWFISVYINFAAEYIKCISEQIIFLKRKS